MPNDIDDERLLERIRAYLDAGVELCNATKLYIKKLEDAPTEALALKELVDEVERTGHKLKVRYWALVPPTGHGGH